MPDPLLTAFQAMVRAETPGALLTGLLGPQIDTVLGDAPPEVHRLLRRSCTAPTREVWKQCHDIFRQLAEQSRRAPSADDRAMGLLLTMDAAAYELLLQDFGQFSQTLRSAVALAAEQNNVGGVILTIDLGWPLVWYRLRKYAFSPAFVDTNYVATIQAIADRFRGRPVEEAVRFVGFAYSVFVGLPLLPEALDTPATHGLDPSLLRSETFLREARSWAGRIDAADRRWSFSAVIDGFARAPV
jgi:hypothetical protein